MAQPLDLAYWNLRHSPARTMLSLSGIGVAITLIFVQMGFQGAIENTANVIYGKMDFDLLVRSRDYLHFVDAHHVPRRALHEVAGLPGVDCVRTLHVTLGNWRHPQGENLRGIVIMGVDPDDPPFFDRDVSRDIGRLTADEYVLIDQKTHPEFGPRDGRRFGPGDVGAITELLGQPVQIVGLFEMGAGLTANGAVMVSETGFARLVPIDVSQQVTYGLIRLQAGVDIEAFRQQATAQLRLANRDPWVEVLTRREVIDRERHRWIAETPIGFIFLVGVGISFVVGAAIVYMVLATDVGNRLGEYATLKAMGYSNGFLNTVVMRQALYLALLSFVPALLATWVIYEVTAYFANVPIYMTLPRLAFVFCLTLAMSGLSGALAMRKLWQAQPAELF